MRLVHPDSTTTEGIREGLELRGRGFGAHRNRTIIAAMIITVTPNPVLDRTLTVPEIVLNEMVRVVESRDDWGGKGFNVSRALLALGKPSVAMGLVGGAVGGFLLKQDGPVAVTLACIALMLLFFFIRLPTGFATLLLAHIAFNIPYAILSISPKLRQLDRHLFEAALDLGARPREAIFKVILPEIMPGIVTALILTFTLSIDDFVISYFTAGNQISTLAITIYTMARKSVNPQINALSTLLFVVVLGLLLLVNSRSGRDMKKKANGGTYS